MKFGFESWKRQYKLVSNLFIYYFKIGNFRMKCNNMWKRLFKNQIFKLRTQVKQFSNNQIEIRIFVLVGMSSSLQTFTELYGFAFSGTGIRVSARPRLQTFLLYWKAEQKSWFSRHRTEQPEIVLKNICWVSAIKLEWNYQELLKVSLLEDLKK